jgi:uncharacterized protein (DUF427 family)
MKAEWRGVTLAQSDDTVVVEGNHYFPRESLNDEFFEDSTKTSSCFWKGKASYYDVVVGGDRNPGAAWYYPAPKSAASDIEGRVAFWRGVTVSED